MVLLLIVFISIFCSLTCYSFVYVKKINELTISIYKVSFRNVLLRTYLVIIVLYFILSLFYAYMALPLLLCNLGFLNVKYDIKQQKVKRRRQYTLQFRHALQSISSSLSAGRSFENAIISAHKDLKMIYPSEKTFILIELERFIRILHHGKPIEEGLFEFAARSEIEDAKDFADVCITCKRTGGDLIQVVRNTAQMISEKIETEQEVQILIAQKKLESKLLMFIPFVLIGLIKYSSPDYLEPLYQGIGVVIMSISLLLFFFSSWLAIKLMNIKV